jgi:integrase
MPRPRTSVPAYLRHKPTNLAYVRLPDGAGGRKVVYLGRYDSAESRQEYRRLLHTFDASPPESTTWKARGGPTVAEVLLAFLRHAQEHYRRPDGTATSEVLEFKILSRAVRGLYGHTPAAEFGPQALAAVRQQMMTDGLCRRVVNKRVSRIKLVFKWATARELVPAAVYQSLATLTGLQKGRTRARDPDPVGPVDDAVVAATLPYLRSVVAAMVRTQRLTGMRPGEVCRLRPIDVDRTGAVWLYSPAGHKMAHRGRSRVIAIGPRAQAVLAPFWPADPHAHVFSPKLVVESFHAERSAKRVTPRFASHMARNASKRVGARKRQPSDRYPTQSYRTAIHRGIDRANADRARHGVPDGPNLPRVPTWGPNQLRHAHATEVRKQFGLEAAQVMLGHARADVTEVYAERDAALALRVATEIG